MNNRGAKALCEAALRGDLEAVRNKLATRTDVDARDRSGSTALTLAAALDNYEMAAFLLKAGADACLAPMRHDGHSLNQKPVGHCSAFEPWGGSER